ncbi:MAG TPA: hypothetical protein VEX69_04700 [Candidatus Limnocylindria bacterium]|nr:hypothetical protein [Candidatus Limnocylindria bacterium]
MNQRDQSGERGGSKLNTVLTLLIVGFLIFTGVKIIPPYFANYQLQDSMETEARFAIANHKGDEEIREDIWKKVQELEIPAKRENIKVNSEQRSIAISLDYVIPVDLRVYQFTLEFHPHADNHTL